MEQTIQTTVEKNRIDRAGQNRTEYNGIDRTAQNRIECFSFMSNSLIKVIVIHRFVVLQFKLQIHAV